MTKDGEYIGYEQDKPSFRGPPKEDMGPALFITYEAFDKAEKEGREVGQAISWLRESGMIEELLDEVPTFPGSEKAIRLRPKKVPYDDTIYLINKKYYDRAGLHNEIIEVLWEINNAVSTGEYRRLNRNAGQAFAASNYFEHGGKMFVPSNSAFQQIAHHFRYLHGLRSCSPHALDLSEDIKKKIGDDFYLVLRLDELPADKRPKVMRELKAALAEVKASLKDGDTALEAGEKFSAKHSFSAELAREIASFSTALLQDTDAPKRIQLKPKGP